MIPLIRMKATNLDKHDVVGSSDPFLIFFLLPSNPKGKPLEVFRTEIIKNNLNPEWKQFAIPIKTLTGGDIKAPFEIHCFDSDGVGKDDLIGLTTATLSRLLYITQYDFIESSKAKTKGYKNSGVLQVVSAEILDKQGQLKQPKKKKTKDDVQQELNTLKAKLSEQEKLEIKSKETNKKLLDDLQLLKDQLNAPTPAEKKSELQAALQRVQGIVNEMKEQVRIKQEINKKVADQNNSLQTQLDAKKTLQQDKATSVQKLEAEDLNKKNESLQKSKKV